MHRVEREVYLSGDRVGVGGNPVEKLRRNAMQLRKENALLEESNLKLEQDKKVLERRLRQVTALSCEEEQFEWKQENEQSLIKVGDEHFFVVDEYKEEYSEKLSVEMIDCGINHNELPVKKEEYGEKPTWCERKFPSS